MCLEDVLNMHAVGRSQLEQPGEPQARFTTAGLPTCTRPTVVFDPVIRKSSADKTSPERTEALQFSKRLHHRASCSQEVHTGGR